MTPLEGWDPLVDNASAHIGADAFERFRILPLAARDENRLRV